MPLVGTRRLRMGFVSSSCLTVVTRNTAEEWCKRSIGWISEGWNTPRKRNRLTHSQPGTHSAVAAHPVRAKARKTNKSCQTSGGAKKLIVDEGIGLPFEVEREKISGVQPWIALYLGRGVGQVKKRRKTMSIPMQVRLVFSNRINEQSHEPVLRMQSERHWLPPVEGLNEVEHELCVLFYR